jgi:lipopolysaccharide biosynthesis regulator YciM
MKHKYINPIIKTKNLYNAINSVSIETVDCRKIFEDAVKYEYNKPLDEYTENNINAIMVNNIRHNHSNYDQVIKQIHRIHRSDNDYEQYKNSVLEKIAIVYPFLKNECQRQKRIFDMVKIVER